MVDVLTKSEMFWLSTAVRDCRPHVTPLPAIWLDGSLHFCTGDAEQKTKNLELNPRWILTTGTNLLRSGLDIVVEGTAVRVTDAAKLERLAELWKSKLDWDYEVLNGAFRDPKAAVRWSSASRRRRCWHSARVRTSRLATASRHRGDRRRRRPDATAPER